MSNHQGLNQEYMPTTVAKRYAMALFAFVQEQNKTEQNRVRKDIQVLETILSASESFVSVIESPVIVARVQHDAIQKILDEAKIGKTVCQFVAVAIRNRRIYDLMGMIHAYRTIEANALGQVNVKVTSARVLTSTRETALKKKFTQAFGNNVQVEKFVDATLLGGLVIQVGSQMIDSSLRNKLQSLKQTMNGVG